MFKLARAAMRTRFEIVLADEADPARLRAAAEEALEEIERVEAQLSAYRPDSDLWRVNARAADGPVRVTPHLLSFLQRALRLGEITDGAFDMTVGPLLRCWGFVTGEGEPGVPDDRALTQARALVGMRRNVLLDEAEGTIRFAQPDVRLDPGAIGKGYALERAADLLRDAGIDNALIHGGTSTICALGAPPGRAGWKVAVQHPVQPEARLAYVSLRNRALSVSAVHGKSFWAEGRRFGHVVDPRTGRPVEHSVLAAVVSDSPTDTDALSTGLLVLGAAGLARISAERPDADLLIASENSAGGSLCVATVGAAFGRASASLQHSEEREI